MLPLNENLKAPHVCPLTLEAPLQPVTTPCGHVFERDALERRRTLDGAADSSLCPVCHAPLPSDDSECYGLAIDEAVRAEVEAWRAAQTALEVEAARAVVGDGISIPAGEVLVDGSSTLGRGSFGQVRRGTWAGVPVAVKQISVDGEGAARAIHAELGSLRSLHHPHVVSLLGTTRDVGSSGSPGDELWIVLELAEHGSLESLLGTGPAEINAAFGSPAALPGATPAFYRLGAEIACALAAIHRRHFVHGALKPANVLIFKSGAAKLADFGLAQLAHTRRSAKSSAAAYTAPEASATSHDARLSPAADIFGLSMLLAHCLSGEAPFAKLESDAAITAALLAGDRPSLPAGVPGGVRRLVARCWAARPADRPDAATVQLEMAALGAPSSLRTRAASTTSLPIVREASAGEGQGESRPQGIAEGN